MELSGLHSLVTFTPRHTKGFVTLTLLLLAESVAFVGAVHQEHQQYQFHRSGRGRGGPTKKMNIVQTLHRSFKRTTPSTRLPNHNLKACAQCFESSPRNSCQANGVDTIQSIPRGGSTETLAAATSITSYNIPLHIWKVLFQAILTAINVVCWLLPLKSKKISQNKLALSLANAFSGGVFLSLAFGHLIPECASGFAEIQTPWPAETPYFLVLVGYLLIFFVEKVAFDAHEIMHEMSGDHPNQTNGEAVATASSRGAIILLGALAVHSVLEMMALGLADSFGDSALLSISIALHQPAESIALLVALLKSGMPEGQIIRYLSVFSCMGPIGVGLGMAVNEYAAPIVDVLMLAVVAGTFVYVGATEVIPEEWEDGQHKWIKFGALLSGIVSILVITQYTMSLAGH